MIFTHIHLPTPFSCILPIPIGSNPQTGPVLPSCSLFLLKEKNSYFYLFENSYTMLVEWLKWYNACLASLRHWVKTLVLNKKKIFIQGVSMTFPCIHYYDLNWFIPSMKTCISLASEFHLASNNTTNTKMGRSHCRVHSINSLFSKWVTLRGPVVSKNLTTVLINCSELLPQGLTSLHFFQFFFTDFCEVSILFLFHGCDNMVNVGN
jgi:hypothetical protein